MNYLYAKFYDFSLSRFGFIVRSGRQNYIVELQCPYGPGLRHCFVRISYVQQSKKWITKYSNKYENYQQR